MSPLGNHNRSLRQRSSLRSDTECSNLPRCTLCRALKLPEVLNLNIRLHLLNMHIWPQGDAEKQAGLPISPLMDRSTKGGMTRSQLGFFSIVGMPMFKSLVELFPDAQPILDGVLDNYREVCLFMANGTHLLSAKLLKFVSLTGFTVAPGCLIGVCPGKCLRMHGSLAALLSRLCKMSSTWLL